MSDRDQSFTGTCPTCGQASHYRTRPTNPNAIFNWRDDGVRYQTGFVIGSEDEDGTHRRDASGWPYSIFKKGLQPGITDVVLCHGIQDLADARILLEIIENTDRRPISLDGELAVLEGLHRAEREIHPHPDDKKP